MDIIIRLRDVSQNESKLPQTIRLRRLLKLALRSFGFRCISVAEAGEAGQARAADLSLHKDKRDK